VFLAMRLPPQLMMAERLTEEEQAQYETWKAQYLNQPDFIGRSWRQEGLVLGVNGAGTCK